VRHEKIKYHREEDDAENGVAAKGRNVARHFLDPRWSERIGNIVRVAKEEKDYFIELC
jgi:hypothetical protein